MRPGPDFGNAGTPSSEICPRLQARSWRGDGKRFVRVVALGEDANRTSGAVTSSSCVTQFAYLLADSIHELVGGLRVTTGLDEFLLLIERKQHILLGRPWTNIADRFARDRRSAKHCS